MKSAPGPAPAPEKKTQFGSVTALLMALCVICAGAAVFYNRQKTDLSGKLQKAQKALEGKQAGRQAGAGAAAGQGASESEKVFDLVGRLAQKESVIGELRQRLVAIQDGRAPEAGLSTNTLPASVRSVRRSRKTEPKALAPKPEPPRAAPVPPPPPAPGAEFPELTEHESFFGSLDASAVSAAERDCHAELLAHIQILRRVVSEMKSRGDATGELLASATREAQALESLMPVEREALLRGIGRDLGYDDESCRLFAEYVNLVDRMTTFSAPAPVPLPIPLPLPGGDIVGPEMPEPGISTEPPPMPGE